ncbi:MAG: RNA 2',3'-cyclic phosphodiesterase [Fimbriiglobus sp.]|jgi:2'-5' RNA ligase|nr:RNA 2',3'-cyclic phosphodiesterase [Fimbriiglobus sp.]
MPRTRTFLGVAVSDDTRRRCTTVQKELAAIADVKWVEPQNLHVTLLFLGELDDRELVDVCKVATAAARREPPFEMRVCGLGAFPTPRRPKVLWGGIKEGTESLLRLHAAIAGPLVESGVYRKEDRDYTPHLTLGRANGDADSQSLAPELPKRFHWDGGTTAVDEVLVYSSELRRSGPEYAVLARSPLLG